MFVKLNGNCDQSVHLLSHCAASFKEVKQYCNSVEEEALPLGGSSSFDSIGERRFKESSENTPELQNVEV